MKKVQKSALQCIVFLLVLAVMFFALDTLLRAFNPIGHLPFFQKNDHEVTIAIHGTSDFDKVFFGSSPVVSAFRENYSISGFVEMGIVLGTVECILAMLERRYITISEELVLGLSIALLMDDLHTDPRYIWNRRRFEPYVYFYRDRLNTFFVSAITNFLNGNFYLQRHPSLEKWLYFGTISDEALEAMIESHMERFWFADISTFSDNLAALERLVAFCEHNNIRLRAVWMPVNPDVPSPELYERVFAKVNGILGGIEVLDLFDAFPRSHFYDIGHMNDIPGAVDFTREIDKWLVR